MAKKVAGSPFRNLFGHFEKVSEKVAGSPFRKSFQKLSKKAFKSFQKKTFKSFQKLFLSKIFLSHIITFPR